MMNPAGRAGRATLLAAALLSAQEFPAGEPGPRPNGAAVLPSGATLRPAGRQTVAHGVPMAMAASPDGRWVLTLEKQGGELPAVVVRDGATLAERSRLPLPEAWLGLAFAPGGKTVYVSGGAAGRVYVLSFDDGAGQLQKTAEMTVTGGGFVGDVAVSPDGRLVYAAALLQNGVFVLNPQSGRVIEKIRTGRRPYRILFPPDGRSFFVSHWADASVGQYRAETGERLALHRTGPHPGALAWSDRKPDSDEAGDGPRYKDRLFVANANTNTVSIFGFSESGEGQQVDTLNIALYPEQPAGMTPAALALSADQTELYVVCSDANAIAVADITLGRARVKGFVPTGAYPTAARLTGPGRLAVANGRGMGFGGGTLSLIDGIDEARLDAWTRTVRENTPYEDRRLFLAHDNVAAASVVPVRPGDPSVIEHVVYIVKGGRNYGDVFDGAEGPWVNHRKLAKEFVSLPHFHAIGGSAAEGRAWTASGIASDFVERLSPEGAAGWSPLTDLEGADPAALPPAGYLWSNAISAGKTVRNFGTFVVNRRPEESSAGQQVAGVRDPSLQSRTAMDYRGEDFDYADRERARVFLADLARSEGVNQFPNLTVMRLGNDRSLGAAPGAITPQALAADNDAALGLIIEGLTRSKFWTKMAIFVLESDGASGTRVPALVISPYTRRGAVDESFYNTASALRTMELMLGLRPMTTFDAGARPMTGVFTLTPNLAAYEAVRPQVALDERNPKSGQ